MDITLKLKQIFNVSEIETNERRSVASCAFAISANNLPNVSSFEEFISLIPQRDEIKITFTSDSEISFEVVKTGEYEEKKSHFIENVENDEDVLVKIAIEKSVQENKLSIYFFEQFSKDLLKQPLLSVMRWFSSLFDKSDCLIFHVFDTNFSMSTGTMAFISDDNSKFAGNIHRESRLQSCRESSSFYNMNEFELIPDDFAIDGIENDSNVFRPLFDSLKTILSAVYISSSATITDEEVNLQINGQRNLSCDLELSSIRNNDWLYSIYKWIYTGGNEVDKIIIARNVTSLHCRYSSLFSIDDKAFESIKSNHALYLRSNVEQYLSLKKELSIFITDIVAKTGDYATSIFSNLKKNLMAIAVFLLTVIIPRMGTAHGWNEIFTRDVLYLLQIILFGSFIYLIICWKEVQYKVEKIKNGYNALKNNYKDVLSETEINDVLNNDNLLNNTVKDVKKGTIVWLFIWGGLLLGTIFIIEFLTTYNGIFSWIWNSLC